MNLATNPTPAQLANLMARCNDATARHMLWVEENGEVHIDPIPENLTPNGFAKQRERTMRFRCETFGRGKDYTGSTAAKDSEWVDKVFRDIKNLWAIGFRGYSDHWTVI